MVFLDTPFDLDTIGQILTIFVIADSLLSLAITYTMGRKAMARWSRPLWIILILVWTSVMLPLIELQIGKPPVSVHINGVDVKNPLTKAAILIWLTAVGVLLFIAFRIFTLDLIKFNKSGLSFEYSKPEKWGIYSINRLLAEKSDNIYFPIFILADEYCRPWKILQRFIISGLTYREDFGAIYFSFTRPPEDIYKQLKSTAEQLEKENEKIVIIGNNKINWKNLIIIDCYSVFAKESNIKQSSAKYVSLRADSNNPHNLNQNYERGLRILSKKGCKAIRVVYDAISDFLTFTDLQLAAQYLRHNMGWEERNCIESLYLFRSGTLNKEIEEYFLWFANGVLKLQRTKAAQANLEDYLACDFRGPFKQAESFNIDFQYNTII